ncbi:MAG TPA: biopolymer transporter ExbD [Rubricoccaceae bacterium]|jgi:biopolymer transport protein ExbD
MIKKMKRRGPTLDMTAMVDVAFLLLTFFMLTTQFKAPEPIPIVLPSSNTEIKLPASNILMITVSEDAQLFVGEEGKDEPVAVRLSDLQSLLVQFRTQNPSLRTVIKADQGVEFGPIEDVMKAMRDADITKFSLITDLEGATAAPAAE